MVIPGWQLGHLAVGWCNLCEERLTDAQVWRHWITDTCTDFTVCEDCAVTLQTQTEEETHA
jgi:hypothetical protein